MTKSDGLGWEIVIVLCQNDSFCEASQVVLNHPYQAPHFTVRFGVMRETFYEISKAHSIMIEHATLWFFTSGLSSNTCSLHLSLGHLFTKNEPHPGYRNPQYKPKTVWRPSQVYNGNPFYSKTVSSEWRTTLWPFVHMGWDCIRTLCFCMVFLPHSNILYSNVTLSQYSHSSKCSGVPI